MMPVKEILAMRFKEPVPPVLVIDEATIKETVDAGPVCGCHEKYEMIQNYTPFIPGGVNPYCRRKIPDSECLNLTWQRARIGSFGMVFDKPVAMHPCEEPKNYKPPPHPEDYKLEDLMFLQLPWFTEEYYMEKMRQCERQHVDGCLCPFKKDKQSPDND